MSADHLPTPVELTRQPAFRLGVLQVEPSTLQVQSPSGRETLEPRVMQVLVVLAQRRGEVVSRDDLIQLCWDGRAVSDDAVNRCIGRLRKLAEARGGFAIETVTRVGFRLTEAGTPAAAPAAPRRSPVALAAGLALVAALILGAVLAWRLLAPARPKELSVSVAAFTSDRGGGAGAFAARLADHVEAELGEGLVGATLVARGAGDAAAEVRLRAAVASVGDRLQVRAFLEDARSRTVLWSGRFDGPASEEAALSDNVAAEVGDVVETVAETRAQPGLRIDPRTVALYVAANEAQKVPRALDPAAAQRAYEQVVQRAPRFGRARGGLALSLANAARTAPPLEREPLMRRAEAEARRALRDDRAAPGGYNALVSLSRIRAPGDLVAAEDVVLGGLKAAPDSAYLHLLECRLLTEVGRARDAVRHCQKAVALRPFGAPFGYSLAHALYVAGDENLARQTAARAFRQHADHFNSWRTLFEISAFSGPKAAAVQLLDSPAADRIDPLARAALAAHLRDGAGTQIAEMVRERGLDPRYEVFAAAQDGRRDDAFAALAAGGDRLNADLGYLFEPVTASLRADVRFWDAATRLGIVRYWKSRNATPDFCAAPGLPYDCSAEIARRG